MPLAQSRLDARATLHRSSHHTIVPDLPVHAARPFAQPALRSKCRAAMVQVNRSFASGRVSHQLIRYNKVKEDSGFAQKLTSIDPVARLSAAHWDEIFPRTANRRKQLCE